MKWRKKALLLKAESTYGVDPTPTGSANAMLVSNLEITPFESDTVSRDNVQPHLGARQVLHTGLRVRVTFDIEVAGSGSLGVAPPYAPALLATGMNETENTGVSMVYGLVSEDEDSVYMYFHMDGSLHKVKGARGNVDIVINALGILVYRFNFLGIYVAPSATADPTVVLTAFQQPKFGSNTNTPTFTLDGFAGKLRSLTINGGRTVAYRHLIGGESVEITDRTMSGEIVIEAPALGTKNFFAVAEAETIVDLNIVHGVTAGNIVEFDHKVQLLQPSYQNEDNIVMLRMGLNLVPTAAGNDESVITVR